MSRELLYQRLDAVRQDEPHLCRLCLFAGAGGMRPDESVEFEQAVRSRLNLDAADFRLRMRQADADWSQRIERMDARILQSRLIQNFQTRNAGRLSQISPAKTRELMSRLLCLSLQAVSIRTGKNHLKTGDLDLLESILLDKNGLLPYLSQIERPVRQVMKGLTTPTSEDFLLTTLLRMELLADYIQATLAGRSGGRMEVIKETLASCKNWSANEIRDFLGARPEPEELHTALHPLRGLQPVL